jgi:hypothetical protein
MVGNLGASELLVVLVIGAVSAIVVIWPAARICAKAGYSPWLGIAAAIPIANVLLLWFLALSEWPARRAA